MKRFTIIAVALAALGLTAWGCNAEKKTDTQAAKKAEQTDAAADTLTKGAYPLDYCIVTGAKLGSMGEPVTLVHEGRTVKFCCQGCVATFKKDPAKWLAKIDEAAAAAKPAAGHKH